MFVSACSENTKIQYNKGACAKGGGGAQNLYAGHYNGPWLQIYGLIMYIFFS